MAIKNRGRNGSVTLAPNPKWGFNWILLAAVAILFVVGILTMSTWGRLFNHVTITVVPKPTQVHTTKPPVTKSTTPTQPTKPTQQPQTFASSPTTVGEAILGSYWTGGKLYTSQGDYGALFNLPKGAEIRAPFDGMFQILYGTNPGDSPSAMIYPPLPLFKQGKGMAIYVGGNAIKFLIANNQDVTKGEVVAIVESPALPFTVNSVPADGNVVVAYVSTSPATPSVYSHSSPATLQEAFPYIK